MVESQRYCIQQDIANAMYNKSQLSINQIVSFTYFRNFPKLHIYTLLFVTRKKQTKKFGTYRIFIVTVYRYYSALAMGKTSLLISLISRFSFMMIIQAIIQSCYCLRLSRRKPNRIFFNSFNLFYSLHFDTFWGVWPLVRQNLTNQEYHFLLRQVHQSFP